MDLDSDRLRAFLEVARCGGFSRAAGRLHRTQPAISQAIRALEADVGEPLFLRLGRGVQLTAAGRVLREQAEQAFAALDVARERLEALRELEAGELVIGTSDTNACYVLPPVLAAFRRRHPRVELRISNRPSPATEQQVIAREVDLGFVTLPAQDRRLRAHPLVEREDVAILPPDHALAGRERVRLDVLAREPLVLLDRGSRTRSWIDERLAERGGSDRAPRVAMELASIEVVKRMVALGFGVSVVPRIAVEAEIEAGVLAAVRLTPRAPVRMLGVVVPRQAPPSRAAAVFIDLARELLPHEPASRSASARNHS
jgi:DNA-binding transcriptional LysR family regulator